MRTTSLRILAALVTASLLILAGRAPGYLVPFAVDLEELTGEADLIFKARAVSTGAVEDGWFRPINDFEARETEFRVVSIVKGRHEGETLRFRHYDLSPSPGLRVYHPLHYHFEPGRTYLVFAKASGTPGMFRQLRRHHTTKDDQGALLCLDDRPVVAGTLREIVWTELLWLLGSRSARDVTYALRQLDEMSDKPKPFRGTGDFDRTHVLTAAGILLAHAEPEVAQAAIAVVASSNPYTYPDDGMEWWMATVGSAADPGFGKGDAKMKNLGGEKYWKELSALGDAGAPVATRALAIRGLGLVRNPALLPSIRRWIVDPEATVRASAALLLADFPSADALMQLTVLSADPASEVRICAAHALGFLQRPEMAGTLEVLLADPDAKVRRAASLSLLAFSPKHPAIATVFRANLAREEFSPLFLIELARERPAEYLEPLAKAVEEWRMPMNGSSGRNAAHAAWGILFRYLGAQPAGEVRAGRFDRYLDAMEKGYVTGSAEPQQIYAFYLQRGMTERAKNYRAIARKSVIYDLDKYFEMVDRAPASFTR